MSLSSFSFLYKNIYLSIYKFICLGRLGIGGRAYFINHNFHYTSFFLLAHYFFGNKGKKNDDN